MQLLTRLNSVFSLLCVTAIIFSASSLAKPSDFEPNITVSIKDVDGKWQVQAQMQTQLSAVDFIALLDSAPKNCNWLHNCKSVILLEQATTSKREIQTRFDSPWPFSDRLMLTKSVIQYSDDKSEVVVLVSPSDLLPSKEALKNTVLVRDPNGTWRLSVDGDKQLLSYEGSAEIDVLIPAFLLKPTLLLSARKTFENIHRLSTTKPSGEK